MNENQSQNSKAGQTMSIIGLVLGILAFILSFVPCIGVWAILPGLVGLILGIIGLNQANKGFAPKGMAITAIVLSVIGSAMGGYQMYVLSKGGGDLINKIKHVTDSINQLKVDTNNIKITPAK